MIQDTIFSDYPICDAYWTIHRGRFSDIDEQAAQLQGYDQVYQQISPGPFRGRFTSVESDGGPWLFIEETNQALVQEVHAPAGLTSFMFLLNADDACRFLADEFASSDLAVLPAGCGFSVRCPPDARFCVVSVQPDSAELPPIPGLGAYRIRSAQTALVVGAMRSLVEASLPLLDPARAAEGGVVLDRLRRSLTAAVALAMMSQTNVDRPRTAARLYVDAQLLIRADLQEIDVERISRALNVSRRKLEMAFNHEVGMGPARYIKLLRLNEIRREIRLRAAGEGVADIASRWGLWHPSHFSASYFDLFGELPSATKLRATAL